jgi:D-apionate oxidoisomerase
MTIALFGAGGKMGLRCATNLSQSGLTSRFVEVSDAGIQRLRGIGAEVTPQAEATKHADVVILAVPDRLIGRVSADVVPALQAGTLVMILDPAAPLAGKLPEREDIAYFVTHPCHPPVVNDETDIEAKMDFYGGVKAKQNIVCALMQGVEEDYARGEQVARTIFRPVMRAHRITVEQMAILEPAMAETVTLTLMATMKEAMQEAIARGVPADAARDFMLGHINVNLGILFGFLDASVSDGAHKAMERGRTLVLKDDWRTVFEMDAIRREIRAITEGA